MSNEETDARGKLPFPSMCRRIRTDRMLKMRQVAEAIGVSPSTIGNMESCNHVVVSRGRVLALARFYQLGPDDTDRLLQAWAALPASKYTTLMREKNVARRALRDKAKAHDAMYRALLEVMSLLFVAAEGPAGDVGDLCRCEFGGGTADDPKRACELCNALQVLGLRGWTARGEVTAHLAQLQEKLDAPESPDLRDSGNA